MAFLRAVRGEAYIVISLSCWNATGGREGLRRAYLRQRDKVFLSIIALIDRGAYKPQEPF